jgi:hypothetical protein
MIPPDLVQLHPYLDRLLSSGIKTDGIIDPIVHNQVFKLNLEQEEGYTAPTELSSCTVHYAGYPICQVRWLDDGVEFFPIRDCYQLLGMMAAVLNTINEMKEGN